MSGAPRYRRRQPQQQALWRPKSAAPSLKDSSVDANTSLVPSSDTTTATFSPTTTIRTTAVNPTASTTKTTAAATPPPTKTPTTTTSKPTATTTTVPTKPPPPTATATTAVRAEASNPYSNSPPAPTQQSVLTRSSSAPLAPAANISSLSVNSAHNHIIAAALRSENEGISRPSADASWNAALEHFYSTLLPSHEDWLNRRRLIEKVDEVVSQAYPGGRVEAFGSFEADLYGPTSDLDLCVECVLPAGASPIAKNRVLANVAKSLQRHANMGRFTHLRHTRVPLLKFYDETLRVHCDLSIGDGSPAVKSRTLRSLVDTFPHVKKQLYLVKAWAQAHDLIDASRNRLNSYAMNLMVLFHLQRVDPPVLPPFKLLLAPQEELDENNITAAFGLTGSLGNMREELQARGHARIEQHKDVYLTNSLQWTTADLFATFFQRYAAVSKLFAQSLCTCPYTGEWTTAIAWRWSTRGRGYCMAIQDPFEAHENPARSLSAAVASHTFTAICTAALLLEKPPAFTLHQSVLKQMFQPPPSPVFMTQREAMRAAVQASKLNALKRPSGTSGLPKSAANGASNGAEAPQLSSEASARVATQAAAAQRWRQQQQQPQQQRQPPPPRLTPQSQPQQS